ncbi:hypothetical protein ABPG72_003170 [Tetrahymena utriculariae]
MIQQKQNNQINFSEYAASEELEDLQDQEKILKKHIGIQLSNLELLNIQILAEKCKKNDFVLKLQFSNHLIQQKDQQISQICQKIENAKISKLKQIQMYKEIQIKYNQEYQNLNLNKMQLADSLQLLQSDIQKYSDTEFFQELYDQQRQNILEFNEELLSSKGRIRVVCRIRPQPEATHKTILVNDDYKVLLFDPHRSLQSPEKNKKKSYIEYTFMKVFEEDSKQVDLFNDLNFFLNSFFQCSNVSIFTYGPTGSGKTFTMFGEIKNQKQKGIIPRCLEQLCQKIEEYEANGIFNEVNVSIVELYNDKIKDLIQNANIQERKEPSLSKLPQGLEFKQKLQFLLQQIISATKNRIVRKTNCNQHSSRSHLVFTIKLKLFDKIQNKINEGQLHLVDLAGSERIQLSQTTGEGQKETIFINQSLQALSAVLKSIKNNVIHIPYRNSLLTQYLRNSLNSNSKTMVILNISSHPTYYSQTKEALNLLCLKQQQYITRSQHQTPSSFEKSERNKELTQTNQQQTNTKNKKQSIVERKLNNMQSTQKTLIF